MKSTTLKGPKPLTPIIWGGLVADQFDEEKRAEQELATLARP